MSSYLSVERVSIQKAFALAHKLACNEDVTPTVRQEARKIATAIWKACGELKPMPAALPEGFPGKPETLAQAIEKGRADYMRVTGQEEDETERARRRAPITGSPKS